MSTKLIYAENTDKLFSIAGLGEGQTQEHRRLGWLQGAGEVPD